jgi:hypothetical protein
MGEMVENRPYLNILPTFDTCGKGSEKCLKATPYNWGIISTNLSRPKFPLDNQKMLDK